MIRLKNSILLAVLALSLALSCIISVTVGDAAISISEIWDVLTNGSVTNPTYDYIIEGRLSRTFVAVLAGSALAIAGLILQVFFRNPLAGPGVLGISSGARLGVASVVLGGLALENVTGYSLKLIAGFAGAIAVLILLLAISKYVHQMVTLLVIGLMLSFFSSAILDILYQFADNDAIREFVVWGLGSFEVKDKTDLIIFSILIPLAILYSFILVKPLNAMSLGADYAKSLGINMTSVRWQIILITGVLTAVVTVFCGPIGFLGMAVPQLSRHISKTQNYLFIIPLTILLGAILALVSDIFVRLFEGGIPLNTATSLIGAPIIIWAIFKLNKRSF